MRLTARRVRRLRQYIAADRCPARPSLTHRWEFIDEGPGDLACAGWVEMWGCAKCGLVKIA